MIPLSDLYYVVVTAYLLQLYQNRSRLLGHIDCNSPLGYLLGDSLKYLLGDPLGYLLKHSLKNPLGHPIQAQNYHFYSRA